MADKAITTVGETNPTIATIAQLTGAQQDAINAAVAPKPMESYGYGVPSFSFPEKEYATKDGKTRTKVRYVVPMLGTAFAQEGVLWCETGQDGDGQPTETYSVGLPRGIVLIDSHSDATKDMANEWKMSVLEAFDVWVQTTTASGKARMAPRLVKKLTAAAPKATPAVKA